MQMSNQPIMWQQFNAFKHGQNDLSKSKLSSRMGKKTDICDFECCTVLGLSFSESPDVQGCSHKTISRVYRDQFEKEKISSE